MKETSRVVKQIYDRIQDEYNGQFDEQHDHWVNSRRVVLHVGGHHRAGEGVRRAVARGHGRTKGNIRRV